MKRYFRPVNQNRPMKRPIVSLSVSDYRQLLLRKPKAEIVKITASNNDWNLLLLQLRTEMSRVKNLAEIIVSIEIPSAAGNTFSARDLLNLLGLLTEPFYASKPILTWGTAEVDTDQFRVVVYAV